MNTECPYIDKGIRCLPLLSDPLPPAKYSNMYIVGEDHLFIIDPATENKEEREKIKNNLDLLINEGYTLDKILLSHQHHDHVSAANWLRQTFGIPIASSAITQELLKPIFEIDEILEDGEIIKTPDGWQLKCLLTPGHAPGHMCFLDKKSSSLFAGDMISGHSSILISQSDGGNMSDYLESLERLIDDFEFEHIYPSHGEKINNGKMVLRDLLFHRLERERKVLEAIKNSDRASCKEILKIAYKDIETPYLPYAQLNMLSIIKKLEAEHEVIDNFYF